MLRIIFEFWSLNFFPLAIKFNIKTFDKLPSTNDYVREMTDNGAAEEGLVVRAKYQSKGKGQQNNFWYSDKEQNLLISLVLRPLHIPAEDVFLISQITALSLKDLLHDLLPEEKVRIKWPNDLYVRDKKIAGILIQNDLSQHVLTSIIGIGLNVNQRVFPSVLPNPTSLRILAGVSFCIEDILNTLLQKCNERYMQLLGGSYEMIREEYNACLYLLDLPALFLRKDGNSFKGVIRKVTDDGSLIIESEGEFYAFGFREVEFPH